MFKSVPYFEGLTQLCQIIWNGHDLEKIILGENAQGNAKTHCLAFNGENDTSAIVGIPIRAAGKQNGMQA